MSLSRDEIINYANRYVPLEEIKPFPFEGEVFAFLHRPTGPAAPGVASGSAWQFGGYAVCLGYFPDMESKPEGKWIWMNSISLSTFPPRKANLRLQPPHVALCLFQNPERTMETRIVSLEEMAAMGPGLEPADDGSDRKPGQGEQEKPANVIKFTRRKSRRLKTYTPE
jgi:hypothetical protein